MKIEIAGTVETKSDDGGCALIAELFNPDTPFFVRLHSWDETKEHPEMKQLVGKRVRVTIETEE